MTSLSASPRVGALIPVRLGSARLRAKQLQTAAGRPLLHHLLDRVAACRFLDDPRRIIVCTTTEPEDDALLPVVGAWGASIFRGARDDIIRRFNDAMDAFALDVVVQVNGDNPFTEPCYMDRGVEILLGEPAVDVTTVKGLPLGMSSTCFTRAAMAKVVACYRSERNDTGYALFFTHAGICHHHPIAAEPEHVLEGARLTLDYPQDLEVFRRIIDALYQPGAVFRVGEIIEFLRAHPEVMAINSGVCEEYDARTRALLNLEFERPDGSRGGIVW